MPGPLHVTLASNSQNYYHVHLFTELSVTAGYTWNCYSPQQLSIMRGTAG
jgi:hypothetical protein